MSKGFPEKSPWGNELGISPRNCLAGIVSGCVPGRKIKPVPKAANHIGPSAIQQLFCSQRKILRNSVIVRFGNTAGYAGQGVGVSTQGDCIANGIVIACRLEECRQCLRHCPLARTVKAIGRADPVERCVKVVSK